jgi:hypothetical protein
VGVCDTGEKAGGADDGAAGAAGGGDIRGDQRSRCCKQHSKTLADACVQKYFDKLRGVDDHFYERVTILCLLVTRSVRS